MRERRANEPIVRTKFQGLPVEIISAIKALYTNTQATLLTPDGETEPFGILGGIFQGDILAPFLFINVIDYMMRSSVDSMKESGLLYQPRKSSHHPALYITDAEFADDITLLSDNLAGAQALLSSLELTANCAGLHWGEIMRSEHSLQVSRITLQERLQY